MEEGTKNIVIASTTGKEEDKEVENPSTEGLD